MREIEVKILDINVKEIERKLLSIGAKKIYSGPVNGIGLDYPDRRFKKKNTVLRLREKDNCVEFTFKELFYYDVKSARELEVTVSDYKIMKTILLKLGFVEVKSYTKYRTSYAIKGAHFEIDKAPGIPAFLEIEARSAKKVRELVKLLGFKMSDAKPWGFGKVLKHYKIKDNV